MIDKSFRSKAPLGIFRNQLSFYDYVKHIRELVPNFNQDVNDQFNKHLYDRYLTQLDSLKNISPRSITLTLLGFYSANSINIQYWLDRGWNLDQATSKIKQRQATCTPEIAKKIQKTLKAKSHEEIADINKRKGNGLNAQWLVDNKGVTYDEAIQHIFDRCSYAGKIKNDKYRSLGKAVSNRQLAFYIDKGLSIEEAKQCLRDRQTTTSLTAYVKRYGEELGLIKYTQRITRFKKKWQDKPDDEKISITRKRLHHNKFFSIESFCFFQKLELSTFQNNTCLYGNDEYFIYDSETKKIYFYDFVIVDKKLIIEYNGSYWHANPDKDPIDWKNKLYTYEESIKKDMIKKTLAESKGFTYITIWDYERNDPKTITNILNINNTNTIN